MTLSAALLSCAFGCATLERGTANALLPPEQEAQLGEKVDAEMKKQVKMLDDATVAKFVEDVGKRVGDFSAKERGPVPLRFQVVDDPKTVNASTTAGGNIYVFSGLLLAAKNEAELAAVLAHEVGHVSQRHIARGLAAQYGVGLLTEAALGKNPGAIAQIATQLGNAGVLAAHTRGEEKEADVAGLRYQIQAGYDPQAMVSFFETLKKLSGNSGGGLNAFFASHPPPEDRMEYLSAAIKQQGASGGDLGQARFAQIRSRLEARYGTGTTQ